MKIIDLVTEDIMSRDDQISYIEYILIHNVFSRSEVIMYQGKSKSRKNPHSIDGKLWEEIANKLGFNFDNLIESENQYYMEIE